MNGYEEPFWLDVEPVCGSCHRIIHPVLVRTKYHMRDMYAPPTWRETIQGLRDVGLLPQPRPWRRLSSTDIADIKNLREKHLLTYGQIGELFDISESMACRIVRGSRYAAN